MGTYTLRQLFLVAPFRTIKRQTQAELPLVEQRIKNDVYMNYGLVYSYTK